MLWDDDIMVDLVGGMLDVADEVMINITKAFRKVTNSL